MRETDLEAREQSSSPGPRDSPHPLPPAGDLLGRPPGSSADSRPALRQRLASPAGGASQASPALRGNQRRVRRGPRKDRLSARPLPGAAVLGDLRAARTMRGCPRLALLCALPWLLRAAAPGHPALPLAPRRDPSRGADFGRLYSGVVSLSTENIYSFNYTSQPGQVRHLLPSLDTQELDRYQPRRCSASPGHGPRETSGARRPSSSVPFKAITALLELSHPPQPAWGQLRFN